MFSFFRKKSADSHASEYFPFSTDMHSHILPGIDDGSPDIKTSIRLVRGLMAMGVNKSIATPHIIGDMFRNNPETIGKALHSLQEEIQRQKLKFEVSAAAEYMLDSYFYELLNSGQPLLTIRDKMILTEFSYASRPDDPGKLSFAIITAGYTPILAHPERYPYYYGNIKMIHRLADLGFLLQVNLLSLTGYYGKEAAKVSQYIIKNDLASFVGTDLHHDRHMQALSDNRNRKLFEKVLSHRGWNQF